MVAKDLADTEYAYCDYQVLNDEELKRLSRRTKLDLHVTGRVISTNEVWHAYKKHSKDESPIEFSDFALIEIIVQYYDSVRYSGKNKQGLDIIVYEKVLGDKFFVAEEVRTKRGKLAFKSIYKVKLKKQRKS